MKISDREKFLLTIVLSISIVLMFVYLIFIPQFENMSHLSLSKESLNKEYETKLSSINQAKIGEGKMDDLVSDIHNKVVDIYPNITQETLILEINKLLKDSSVDGNISFTSISELNLKDLGINSDKTTLQIVDEYDKKNKEVINSNIQKNEPSEIIVTINFEGQYEQVEKLVSSIENGKRDIAISNLNILSNDNGVTGSMQLKYTSIPKFGNEDEEYYNWSKNNVYGKDNPFKSN